MPWNVPVAPALFLWMELFPAQVHLGTENDPPFENQELKVSVTDNHFYVFEDTVDGPAKVVEEVLLEFDGSNKTGYTVTTDQNTYFFRRATNCGCGSRLRGFRPFEGVPLQARNLRK